MDITLEDVIGMLEDIQEDIDYEEEDGLIDNDLLDSFDILAIVSAVDEEFDVEIPAKEITPDNFNSAEALHQLIVSLSEED